MESLHPSQNPNHPEPNINHEAPGGVSEENQITYYGLRAAISEWRMERAGDKMERMDHKSALYADLGNYALIGSTDFTPSPTASGDPARPRTAIERLIDKRTTKKVESLEHKAWKSEFLKSVYGGKPGHSKVMGRINALDTRLQARQDYKDGTINASQFLAVKRASKEALGPIDELYQQLLNGAIDTREFTEETKKIKPVVYEYSAQRNARKSIGQTKTTLDKKSKKYGSDKWEKKGTRAIGAIQTHHRRAEEYRRKQTKAKARRDKVNNQ